MRKTIFKFIMFIFIVLTITDCPSNSGNNATTSDNTQTDSIIEDTTLVSSILAVETSYGFYTRVGDSLLLPPFEVHVTLTLEAKDSILTSGETITISVNSDFIHYNDLYNDDNLEEYEDDYGLYCFFHTEQKISYPFIAKFNNIKIPLKVYNALKDKDLSLEINVFNSRDYLKNNVLRCQYFGNRISEIKYDIIEVDCDLLKKNR